MMKNRVLIVTVMFLLTIWGCKKDENPVNENPVSEPVPANVFPLTPGNRFEFNGYLTKEDTEEKISGSEAGFSASWTIFNETTLTPTLPSAAVSHITKTSAILIVDSVKVTGVLVEPKVTPVFAYYDAASGDYYYLTNLGNFFREQKIYESISPDTIVRGDSLRFIKLASPKVGTIDTVVSLSEDFPTYLFGSSTPSILTLRILISFVKKENITLNVNGIDTTFTTYLLVVMNRASFGDFNAGGAVSAKFWLADGIGPVQMFLAGDNEAPGSFRQLKSKNF